MISVVCNPRIVGLRADGAINLFRELALKIRMFLQGGLKLSNYQRII